MVLVARAHVGSNPTYHPNILKDIPVYETGEVTVGNQCVVSYNQGKSLELYRIVECKGIYRGLCLCQSNKHLGGILKLAEEDSLENY